MVYQGSKNRLAKFLVPIIQKYIDDNNIKTYIEPMVGGANLIDKIKCDKKIGADINEELIALLKYAQSDNDLSIAPDVCTFEHYSDVREDRKLGTHKYSKEYIALIGYCASYGGRYFDGGYGRDSKGGRSIYNERLKNFRTQIPDLNDIEFRCCRKLVVNMIGNYFYYNSSDCEITTIIILDSYKDVVDARKVKNI
jgi:DNA adenine methylase